MDIESGQWSKGNTDNMAASEAPANTINVCSGRPSSGTETNNIEHNFHELCRSCGKSNAELYDLFQTTNSPFSTSSTTCYTHLNNCSLASSTLSSCPATKPSTSTTTTTTTATTTSTASAPFPAAGGCTKSAASLTFDGMAATAKATAKGQSNMDNILQEMQIWQLLIKCNDGLPQRICAKCTAQFYMIHKFRRKCLKVQTQLRALYEEQQKFYERQQQIEKNVTVKDATIEATSTPNSPAAPSASRVAASAPALAPLPAPASARAETALLVDVVKPPVMHKVNDLVNDNYCEPQQTIVDNTNKKPSVSFEANTGNTNDFIAPSTTATTTTLVDNTETMPQKTEANEPTPTSSAPAFIDKTFEARIQEHCTVATGLKLNDEKKPLLKPAVLDSKRSPPLTLQQPLEQICDNGRTTTEQTNSSKKLCLDQEKFLHTHIIFKANIKQNIFKQCLQNDEELSEKLNTKPIENIPANSSPLPSALTKSNEIFKLRLYEGLNLRKECTGLSKPNPENLFITKAALKAYTIPPSTSETENRDHQKPITNSEAFQLKNTNDNNNNAHRNIYSHRYDNQNEQLNDNTCSSTSNTNTNTNSTASSCSPRKPARTTISKRKIIKYANHNRRPGHCCKSNTKVAMATIVTATATTAAASTIPTTATTTTTAGAITKMARTMPSYGGSAIVVAKRKQKRSQRDKNQLKRRLSQTSSPSAKGTPAHRKKHQKENIKKCHQKSSSIQMEDEMSSSTVSTTSMSTSASTSATSSTSSSPSASASASPSAISSTSSHLRATTPAITGLVENCAAATAHNHPKQAMKKEVCSSADRLSSNTSSCIMWKTKAAMKVNTNDMPVEEAVNNNSNNINNSNNNNNDGDEPAGNVPEISLPYTALPTLTGSTSSLSSPSSPSLLSSSPAVAADRSSKTLIQNQDTSICLKGNNNKKNNYLMEYCSLDKVKMSSSGNQVKDIEDENIYVPKMEVAIDDNPQPELAAGQNQEDVELKSDNLNTCTTTQPRIGSMKLIIQRKRGKHFKCRRKYDDETLETDDQATTTKRKKKSSQKAKQEVPSLLSLSTEYFKGDEQNISNQDRSKGDANKNKKIAGFPSEGDENKENPFVMMNSYEVDSDSNVSVYRDPLLTRNEMLEDDTHVTDFSKTPLSLQTECSKEMYKLYKEKANLESPKKLIVRVPLTSLTQDFKRLHLTMDEQENGFESGAANEQTQNDNGDGHNNLNGENVNDEIPSIEVADGQYDLPISSLADANSSSIQSDFLGFSQTTESSSGNTDSSQSSVEAVGYAGPALCSASSKINDFINDFQNNCIDSSEIDESCEIIPTLVPGITQELSDEIRDVEDTLNGILNEMHDKDKNTPRSAETDEFFGHSVYSPLTDTPTTPSQSFYAESPCTISSNPMSVSPYIHHNMDYNAMTPQSNHSSMGIGGSSILGGGASTGPHTTVYSEHYPTYNESFEENAQSELIGFQNDIPCFENIEMTNSINPNELTIELKEEEDVGHTIDNSNINSTTPNYVSNNEEIEESADTGDYVQLVTYEDKSEELFAASQPAQPQAKTITEVVTVAPDMPPQQVPYGTTTYQQLPNNPTFQLQNVSNPLISRTTTTQPHYIVTNGNQGPIIITNPQLNQRREQIEAAFKPQSNNLQFVTLGQAMDHNRTQANSLLSNTNKINWPTTINATSTYNQQPVISAANGTTTYFINANGELYQANIPTTTLQNRPVSTIFVPPNTPQTFNKTNIDNSDNFMPSMQQQLQPQRPGNAQSSQYIMLVNNLNGSPQYYTSNPANLHQAVSAPPQSPHNITTPAVLFHSSQIQNIQNNSTNTSNNTSNSTCTNNSFHKTSPIPSTSEAAEPTKVPASPELEPLRDTTAIQTTVHQKINPPQLQTQIKQQRPLHVLQPRSSNVTQQITLVCRFCHKRPKFTNNVDYSNHIINTHPAEKPFNCPHCSLHFIRRSERQMHVTQAHGSRYQCAQCGLTFCAQRTLDFHLQKYHANFGRSQQHPQHNSSSTTTTAAAAAVATAPPIAYHLLQRNQQQRLVRVEDVHVQVTDENKNKRSIDLALDGGDGSVDVKTSQSINEVELLSHAVGTQQQQHQQQRQPQHQQQHQQQQQQQQHQRSRKLCCPDCNGDNAGCCGMNQNYDQSNINSNTAETTASNCLAFSGNASVNNPPLHVSQHVTIPSPEQTEPDSTTTLRHFRKRQLGDLPAIHFASASPSSSSLSSAASSSSSSSSSSLTSSSSSFHNNAVSINGGTDNINLNHNSPDNVLAGDGGGEQIAVERALRGSHNCLLCEESFTNEIALRKHHHLAHGAATQSTTCTTAITSMPLVCTICKRAFRMRNALQRHMETHDAEGRPYECNICQVRFPRPSQLTLHKLTVHKFEKPNSCEQCGKQFGTESAMKAHAAEHREGAGRAANESTSEASKPLTSSSQMQLQSTTVGREMFFPGTVSANGNDAFNNATQQPVVSGLIT